MFTAELLLVVAVLVSGAVPPQVGPLVHVEQGALRGTYQTSASGRIFSAFHGIPYARPPTGKHRFKVHVCINIYTHSESDLYQTITIKTCIQEVLGRTNHNMDPIENITSDSSSTVVCVSLAVGTCLLSFCQAISLLWLHYYSFQVFRGGGGRTYRQQSDLTSLHFCFFFIPPQKKRN
jgi:hypothetical protein